MVVIELSTLRKEVIFEGVKIQFQFWFESKFAFTVRCSVCTDARRVLKFHFCSPEEKDEED